MIKGIDIGRNTVQLVTGTKDKSYYKTIYYDSITVRRDEIVLRKNDKWGIIIMDDNLFIPPDKYDYISKFFNNIACIKINNKYGLINKKGEEITPIIYDSIKTDGKKMSTVIINNLIGYIDDDGNIELERTLKIKKLKEKINE